MLAIVDIDTGVAGLDIDTGTAGPVDVGPGAAAPVDAGPRAGWLAASDGEPTVVVGVSRSGGTAVSPGLLDRLDVALVVAAAGPQLPERPWVAVPDVDTALGALADAVGASPLAAAVLVQLLRRPGAGRSVDDDLLAESLAYSTLQAGPEHRRWLAGRPARRRVAPGGGEPVRLERTGDELVVTLHRPDVRNAYDAATRDGLCEALDLAARDPTIARVRLRGDGPAFCSGGDLDEFGTGPDPVTCHLIRTRRSAARLLAGLSDRVTAEIHGACVGAGVELAAFAGRVVAAPDTRLRLPETAMGLVPGAGGTASLPRRIGRHRTAWLGLTGAWLSVDDALAWGLVDEVAGSGGQGPVARPAAATAPDPAAATAPDPAAATASDPAAATAPDPVEGPAGRG